ncbi:MAG: hypothetical protein KY464_04340 [Gemmatimonadetes bacterium]|nr:hypothetical protein [Gemmatimonadota bacterium]
MRSFALIAAIPAAFLLAACESTNTNLDPMLVTDTIELVTPTANSTLPTAVDITALARVIVGGRYPEELNDAGEWDFALRRVGSELQFVPAGKIGVFDLGGLSRAGITEPLNGRSFESVTQAPKQNTFITDRGVPVRVGEVYAARSRLVLCGPSAVEQYAKLQPLEVDAAAQRVRFRLVTNSRCADQRLSEED